MAGASPDAGLVATIVVLLGVGTYGLRLSFIQLHAWIDEFPPLLEDALVYVPPAVMAALVFPALFALDGTVQGVLNLRVIAGALAAVVAWRTGSMLATIVVGMVVLWTGTFLVG